MLFSGFIILEKVVIEVLLIYKVSLFLPPDCIIVSILYLFFRISQIYFKSSLLTRNIGESTLDPFEPSFRYQIASANGVK
jgi:hypothetical protein